MEKWNNGAIFSNIISFSQINYTMIEEQVDVNIIEIQFDSNTKSVKNVTYKKGINDSQCKKYSIELISFIH